ncbi:Protein of unknown function [Pyronema omphalodes CBS 100304]|uniref:Uncharacterized protein n=1 Tax=Pyronema omphalodes (strain CBS 100304) TaxID=1076935 RepID=U4LPC4_PYROM|nr:Protein of unknown function [Pyronema omphalodes CBS 100304]
MCCLSDFCLCSCGCRKFLASSSLLSRNCFHTSLQSTENVVMELKRGLGFCKSGRSVAVCIFLIYVSYFQIQSVVVNSSRTR